VRNASCQPSPRSAPIFATSSGSCTVLPIPCWPCHSRNHPSPEVPACDWPLAGLMPADCQSCVRRVHGSAERHQ
jgi:hypothetical protein